MNNESASKERKTTTKTAAKKKTSDKTLFTLHLIGPSKPVQIKYHISSFNLQIIDKGTTYALSTDNKLTYRLNPGKYEVRINRYSRIVNVGSASDVDFIFDCSHRTSSIQIIGDLRE
jgi:hypothetical protein